MSPEPEQIVSRPVKYVVDHVTKAAVQKGHPLRAGLDEAVTGGRWGDVAVIAQELKRIESLSDRVGETAAAFLAALKLVAELGEIPDFPGLTAVEVPAVDIRPKLDKKGRMGGPESKYGDESRFAILGELLKSGKRSDRVLAKTVFKGDSPGEVTRVTSVVSYLKHKLLKELGGEEQTVGDLVDRVVKKGGFDPRMGDIYRDLVEKYGTWKAADFIDQVLVAQKGRGKAKEEKPKTKEVELDRACEWVLAASFLGEGAIENIQKVTGIANLETFARDKQVIGAKVKLIGELEAAREIFPGDGKVTSGQCREAKIKILDILRERKPAEVGDMQIGSKLLVEIALEIKGDSRAQKVFDILFPGVTVDVTEDGSVHNCR